MILIKNNKNGISIRLDYDLHNVLSTAFEKWNHVKCSYIYGCKDPCHSYI